MEFEVTGLLRGGLRALGTLNAEELARLCDRMANVQSRDVMADEARLAEMRMLRASLEELLAATGGRLRVLRGLRESGVSAWVR